jgi:hypothetical protein
MTPRLIAALVLAGVIVAALVGIYWNGRLEGVARERSKVEVAERRAAIVSLETRGEIETSGRSAVAARRGEAAARSVTQAAMAAMKSEDADARLDLARVARLRAADDQLCGLAPELAGCAPPNDASGSAKAVRTPSAARRSSPS